MDPDLVTQSSCLEVLKELVAREPLLHRPQCGTTRRVFEDMIAPGFWEIGASGRRYSRESVLQVLERRARAPRDDRWEPSGFHCLEIAPDNYLLTYVLKQGRRETQRASIWRRTGGGWKILFHQGTLVEGT